MWTEDGCHTDTSKRQAGNFSGSADCQWGISSASYVQLIKKLKSDTWEEIVNGALKFAKLGKRSFKPSPVVTNARACIIDSDSEDDSDSFSFTEHDNTPQEDAFIFPSPAVLQDLDSCTQSGTQSAPQELVSKDSVSSQPTAGLMDFSCQLPLLVSVCPENTSSFASSASTILFPFLMADSQFLVLHSPRSTPMNMASGVPGLRWEEQHSLNSHSTSDGTLVPHQDKQKPSSHGNMLANPTDLLPPFTYNFNDAYYTQSGGFVADDPLVMPSDFRFGNKFLTGPLRMSDAPGDDKY